MNTAELQMLHRVVWQFRREIADYWPTPTSLDSLRYAFSEAGEAMSDWLRINHADHKRNHQKEPDLYGELADTALMLLSALGPDEPPRLLSNMIGINTPSLDTICEDVADALGRRADNAFFWREFALAALEKIANYPGMDLRAELQKRMGALRAKWTPVGEAL